MINIKAHATRRLLSLAMLSMILNCFTWFSGVSQKNNNLRIGVAKLNITPTQPIPMSGYGGRQGPYQGIHDSLYVFATVFDDGETQAAMITADLIGFSNQFYMQTGQIIEQRTGIPVSKIMLAATHNHGGPRNNTYGSDSPPEVDQYVDWLQQQVVEAVQQAASALVPVKIGVGKGKCTMNINRRAPFADGNIWLGRNPDGPCDQEVTVVRIDNQSGVPISVLTNWATHGTTGGQQNLEITADWPGAASRFVEEMMEVEVTAPITVGASADINPIYGPNDRFRDIDAIGKLLAKEVVEVSDQIDSHPVSEISMNQRTIIAKGRKPTDNYRPDQELEAAEPVEIVLTVLKVGGVVFVGISGEVMTEIGMAIKEKSPYKHTVIVTHCNGSAGYLVTDKTFEEGGYEAMVSRVMPGTADMIIEQVTDMLTTL